MIVQTFDLNLIPDQSPVVVHVDQYDTGTGRLLVSLYDGDLPYTPSGTAIIQGTKPDGHGFNYSCTISGNHVTANLTDQMTPVAGDVRTQIVITESSGRTGTFAFILRVQKSALPDDTDMSESEYAALVALVHQAEEAATSAGGYATAASDSADDAEESSEDSEAWAVGTRDGVPVPSTDPTYENNAKYWAQHGTIPNMTASILGIGRPNSSMTIENGVFGVPTMSGSILGVGHPDSSMRLTDGVFGVPTMTASILGIGSPNNNMTVSDGSFGPVTMTNAIKGIGHPDSSMRITDGVFGVPTMTSSILGIGSPDGMTTEVSSGEITARGVAIYSTINPSGTEHGANWLLYGGEVITPSSVMLYMVYIDGDPTLWTWSGSEYVAVTAGAGGLISILQSDFNALPAEQKDDPKVWWWISDASGAVSTSGNNYNQLTNKPSIDGHVLIGAMKSSAMGIGGTYNYDELSNRPQINGVTLTGNIQSSILGIVGDYDELDNRPQINGVTLTGNKTGSDLGISGCTFTPGYTLVEILSAESRTYNAGTVYGTTKSYTTEEPFTAITLDGFDPTMADVAVRACRVYKSTDTKYYILAYVVVTKTFTSSNALTVRVYHTIIR